MDSTVKIRVAEGDLDSWRRAAGHRGVSAWIRGLAAAEVRRLAAEQAVSDEDSRPKAPPGVALPSLEAPFPAHKTCRHGLVNCRVCGTGVFGG